jgi:hypothetical protein
VQLQRYFRRSTLPMEFPMFWRFLRSRGYHWSPAVDMRDGRIAAALMTFSSN